MTGEEAYTIFCEQTSDVTEHWSQLSWRSRDHWTAIADEVNEKVVKDESVLRGDAEIRGEVPYA